MKGEYKWVAFDAHQFLYDIRQLNSDELREAHRILRIELLDIGAMLKLPMIETVMAEAVTKEFEDDLRLIQEDLPTTSYRDRAMIHAKTRLLQAEAGATLTAAKKIIDAVERYEDALPEGVDGWMAEAGWK